MMSKDDISIKEEFVNTHLFSEYGDIVSVEDVMKMLHIGRTAVYNLLKTKAIRTVKVGRKYIISKQSVIDFLSLC